MRANFARLAYLDSRSSPQNRLLIRAEEVGCYSGHVLRAKRTALRLNRPEFCLQMMGALRCGATFGGLGACATDRFGATSSRQRMSLMGRYGEF